MTRRIIAIDGNVNTGKTTLAHNLSKEYPGFVLVNEYNVETEKDDYARQMKYLVQDENRVGINEDDLILDRSILSLCAYVYWLYKKQGVDFRVRFYNEYILSLARVHRIPNMVILCYQDLTKIRDAYSSNKDQKGTDSFLVEDEYVKIQDDFYKVFQSALGDKIICYDYCKDIEKIDVSDEGKRILSHEFLFALQKAMRIDDTPCIYSIDGISAVGKSSLCQALSLHGFVIAKEIRNENNTNSNESLLDHQTEYFMQSVARYSDGKRTIVDNGFLENIAFTFYMANKENYGISFVESFLKRVIPLAEGKEINQLFFLYMDRTKIENRRDSDLSKNRKHFLINIEMHNGLNNMVGLLTEALPPEMLVRIDASNSKEEVLSDVMTKMHYYRMNLSDFLRAVERNISDIYQAFGDMGE